MINASARFELLSAKNQLIDFQMNRFIKYDQKKKNVKQYNREKELQFVNMSNLSADEINIKEN